MTATALQPNDAQEVRRDSIGRQITVLSKLDGVDPHHIIGRYLQDHKTADIARDYGITRQGLGYWLRKTAEDDWKEAQVILAIERKDRAEQAIDESDDALSLARAREQLKAAQWDLERVCKRIYGQAGPNINIINGITVDQALDSVAGDLLARVRTIEGERVADNTNAALHSVYNSGDADPA